jgi:Cu(I)/Ag(I) efflux system membrane fusion protein
MLACILLAGCIGESQNPVSRAEAAEESAIEHAVRHADPTFVCPMHPQIVRNAEASCPICGMDLVEKDIDAGGGERPEVRLSPAVVQNMGVRTDKVARGTLWKYIRSQGSVAYDDDRILHIHARAAGWIENLYVRTEGERVQYKDDLLDFFSPAIVWAQMDYATALEGGEVASFGGTPPPGSKGHVQGTHNILKYLKLPKPYIKAIEDSGEPRALLPFRAPQGGVVTYVGVREGMYVEPEDRMFTIVDLSTVWVIVDIPEHQIAWVRPGVSAEVTSAAYPGRTWEGKVDFVYPEVHPYTRTLRVRLAFSNPDEMLLPNMFVEAVIYGGPKHDTLTIPREALIVSGEREAVVKALGEGRFQPVEVQTGMWRGDAVEILAGLDEGEEIVVSGQFLIDSESSLQASFLRMTE